MEVGGEERLQVEGEDSDEFQFAGHVGGSGNLFFVLGGGGGEV